VICYFLDNRSEFIAALAQKLGPEFTLLPADEGDDGEKIPACDVVLVQIPALESPAFVKHMDML